MLLVLGASGARAPQLAVGSDPTTGIYWLRLPLPYFANVWFRCLNRFKGILQLFLMDVAKVAGMFAHIAYVASVSEACCKRLFKIFHLF